MRLLFVLVVVTASVSSAGAGVCATDATSAQACLSVLQNAPGVLTNDIFKDSTGRAAPQLPVFGSFFPTFGACSVAAPLAGTWEESVSPFSCPGSYTATSKPNTTATLRGAFDALDRVVALPCRIADDGVDGGCPDFTCVADGTPGHYVPAHGVVMDLGAASNQVAIFGTNDHGPQPCESLEYTVFFSDDPFAAQAVLDPRSSGVDPSRWNRGVLRRVFTHGWVDVRPADPTNFGASCGDTASFSVEDDTMVQVFALPCGVSLRYVSVLGGNDGRDFAECGYDSNEAELDAVAGLTGQGAGVCPDADHDGFQDCACPGAPAVCDCDDANPATHPGAPEACDSADVDCDGTPGACGAGQVCVASQCLATCDGGSACAVGAQCAATPMGAACLPGNCSSVACPSGSVCTAGQCWPDCQGVRCPAGQSCVKGACADECRGVACAEGRHCEEGACVGPCSCFAGDVACADRPGTVCDRVSDRCVVPACVGASCAVGTFCGADGGCLPLCNPAVVCPAGQACSADAGGCAPYDAGSVDAGAADAGAADAGAADAGAADAGGADAGTVDSGTPDSGAPDAGTGPETTPRGCGCAGLPGVDALVALAGLLRLRRRRGA